MSPVVADTVRHSCKKLWVGLASCTMFMVASAEECAAADLRIDGPQ